MLLRRRHHSGSICLRIIKGWIDIYELTASSSCVCVCVYVRGEKFLGCTENYMKKGLSEHYGSASMERHTRLPHYSSLLSNTRSHHVFVVVPSGRWQLIKRDNLPCRSLISFNRLWKFDGTCSLQKMKKKKHHQLSPNPFNINKSYSLLLFTDVHTKYTTKSLVHCYEVRWIFTVI